MIVTADANKGASNAPGNAVQVQPPTVQAGNSGFDRILSAVGVEESGPVGLDSLAADTASAGQLKQRQLPDPLADGRLSAILAAWLVRSGGAGALPELTGGSGDQGQAGPDISEVASNLTETGAALNLQAMQTASERLAFAMMAATGSPAPLNGTNRESELLSAPSGQSQPVASLLRAILSNRDTVYASPNEASLRDVADLSDLTASLGPDLTASLGPDLIGFAQGLATGGPKVSLPFALVGGGSLGQGSALAIAADLLGGTSDPSSERFPRSHGLRVPAEAEARAAEGASDRSAEIAATGGSLTPHFRDVLEAEALQRTHLESADRLLSSTLLSASGHADPQAQALSPSTRLAGEMQANASAIEGSVSWLASQHGGSATIDLSPPDLGSLKIELKVDASGTSASLIVHAANDAARVAVEQALDRLYEAFQASGMSLNVSVGSGFSGFGGGLAGFQGAESRDYRNSRSESSVSGAGVKEQSRSIISSKTETISYYA